LKYNLKKHFLLFFKKTQKRQFLPLLLTSRFSPSGQSTGSIYLPGESQSEGRQEGRPSVAKQLWGLPDVRISPHTRPAQRQSRDGPKSHWDCGPPKP
jgi:hypothetical protein